MLLFYYNYVFCGKYFLMMNTLIGRKKEVEILRQVMKSDIPEFIAVIGRRRIGKTYLVKQVYQQQIDFELTGIQHATKAEQLQNFTFAIRTFFPDHELEEKPKSWLEAFFLLSRLLDEKLTTEKMIVFLDELPWLGSKRSAFIKGLSWFWNSWAVNKNIVVVICGSAASWMIDKVINDRGGLHNRVTQIIQLVPFTLGEVETFLRKKRVRLNRYQITQLYMTMGGVPMYLNQIQAGQSAVQNIQRICFQPKGYLRKEFERLFSSLFDNYERYISVVRVLANKRVGMVRNDIATQANLTNGSQLTRVLSELNESGFIEIYNGYSKKTRQSLYRLTDPYSLFYLTFIERLGKNNKTDFTKLSELPNFKTWSGYAFENVCLIHIDQLRKALGIAGIYTSISSFVAAPKNGLPGAQIDLLIDRSDQSINLCEMKFSGKNYEISKRDVENWQQKKRVFSHHTKTKKHIFLSLITTFGAAKNQHFINEVDQLVVLDDLFA